VNKKVDYLIVGQGLAGTFLAFQLMQKGKTVMVVDKGLEYSSSRVAAGVINPIVLRRFTVTWRAKEFLHYNPSFYENLDQYLGKQYHFNIPLKKLISSQSEIDFWEHRYHKDDVSDFIHQELTSVSDNIFPTENFKVGLVKHSSWLNISALLVDFRGKLEKENALMPEEFNYSELLSNQYKNIEFGRIVFCEGARGKDNPLFKNLPFSLNKGQLITVENSELPSDSLLKKKVFILPTSKNHFKIGATYSWKWDTSSEKAAHKIEEEKTELLKTHLEEMTTANYKVIAVETGIRPSIKDRRPLIGQHSEKKNVYMFNGMGTRGCFMAPLLVEEFISHVENGTELNSEVNLNRFIN
jgi:glycine/D-amino acid oxidase-like deaminating enzyme